jgi:membrane protein implicated in regulation of membrane protease activity
MALVIAILLAIYVLPTEWGIVVVAGAAVLEIGETWFWYWLSHRRRPTVGVESLVGMRATVVTPCRPTGQVRVAGELWQARCDGGADPGDVVDIEAVEGLTLLVAR